MSGSQAVQLQKPRVSGVSPYSTLWASGMKVRLTVEALEA